MIALFYLFPDLGCLRSLVACATARWVGLDGEFVGVWFACRVGLWNWFPVVVLGRLGMFVHFECFCC